VLRPVTARTTSESESGTETSLDGACVGCPFTTNVPSWVPNAALTESALPETATNWLSGPTPSMPRPAFVSHCVTCATWAADGANCAWY
jgi:hypothetical protein